MPRPRQETEVICIEKTPRPAAAFRSLILSAKKSQGRLPLFVELYGSGYDPDDAGVDREHPLR